MHWVLLWPLLCVCVCVCVCMCLCVCVEGQCKREGEWESGRDPPERKNERQMRQRRRNKHVSAQCKP